MNSNSAATSIAVKPRAGVVAILCITPGVWMCFRVGNCCCTRRQSREMFPGGTTNSHVEVQIPSTELDNGELNGWLEVFASYRTSGVDSHCLRRRIPMQRCTGQARAVDDYV